MRGPSEAFLRWFGNSAIAIDGNPLIVYHGGADIPLQRYRFFRTGAGKWGHGAYFTPLRWKAQHYADMVAGGGVVGEYFLRVERPVVIYEAQAYSANADRLMEAARTEGDGLIIVDAEYGRPVRFDRNVSEIVIFDPRQAKSVENVGTFDPEDRDVLHGLRRR